MHVTHTLTHTHACHTRKHWHAGTETHARAFTPRATTARAALCARVRVHSTAGPRRSIWPLPTGTLPAAIVCLRLHRRWTPLDLGRILRQRCCAAANCANCTDVTSRNTAGFVECSCRRCTFCFRSPFRARPVWSSVRVAIQAGGGKPGKPKKDPILGCLDTTCGCVLKAFLLLC